MPCSAGNFSSFLMLQSAPMRAMRSMHHSKSKMQLLEVSRGFNQHKLVTAPGALYSQELEAAASTGFTDMSTARERLLKTA